MGIRREPLTKDDLHWMRLAVEQGKQSQTEPGKRSPKVGVVVVRDGQVLSTSFRGETGEGKHAEYCVLEKLGDIDPVGATVYTTLEPCSQRSPSKTPCADHLINRKVATLFIGMYDPDPRIYCCGWRTLHEAGVILRDFDRALREEIRVDNREFIDQFRHVVGLKGSARFDHRQNDGRFTIYAGDQSGVTFETRWTRAGKGSIYAYDARHNVAHARYHTELDQIDDPSALAFDGYTCSVKEGGVVVFRNDSGYALIKVTSVLSGSDYGDDRSEVCFSYELRLQD